MQITKSQKKYIKRNIHSLSLSEIANNLKISESDIKNHLQEYWGKEKFQRFTQRKISESPAANPPQNLQFDPKTFLRQNWKYLLLLSILVFATFSNSIKNDFLSDDIAAIRDNQNLGKISNFLSSKPPFISFNTFVHFVLYSIFGKVPAVFRAINIVSHLGSSMAIFIIVSFTLGFPLNIFASAIFAVHPLLSEAVVWISGMPYSLGSFFCFTSLLLYLISKTKGKKYLISSLFLFLLGMLTNEKMIFFPIILLVYEAISSSKLAFKTILKNTAWFSSVSFLWFLVLLNKMQVRSTDLKVVHYQQATKENLFLKVPVAIGSYLKLIFWPKDISFYHSELNFSKIQFSFLVFLLILYLSLTGYCFFKNKKLFFWLALFFVSLLPTLAPFGLGWVVAERYVYFGSIGIFVFVSWGIYNLCKLIKKPKLSYLVVGTIVILLSVRTILRNRDFRNQDYLWLASAKTSPSSPQNHNNLGDLYARRKEYDKAIEEFNIAIALKPNYGDAYHNVANIYVLTNQLGKAIEHYNKALEFNPNLWQSHQNLGSVYYTSGKLDMSEQEFRKAVQINPKESSLHAALGLILSNTGKKEESILELKTALEINPQNVQAQQWLQQAINPLDQPPK